MFDAQSAKEARPVVVKLKKRDRDDVDPAEYPRENDDHAYRDQAVEFIPLPASAERF